MILFDLTKKQYFSNYLTSRVCDESRNFKVCDVITLEVTLAIVSLESMVVS